MPVRLSPFRAEDFAEYASWFSDPALNTHLGPMDQAWLDATLAQTNGTTYRALDGKEFVGVIGIVFPNEKFPFYVITELATKPSLRRSGIGSDILNALFALHPLAPGEHWEVYIDDKNDTAKSFFAARGWKAMSPANEAGMVTYEKR